MRGGFIIIMLVVIIQKRSLTFSSEKMEALIPSGKEAVMTRIWSRPIGVSDPDGQDYWDYFGIRLVELAEIFPGAKVLDVACGTGSSLFPAVQKTGIKGFVIGFDICPG